MGWPTLPESGSAGLPNYAVRGMTVSNIADLAAVTVAAAAFDGLTAAEGQRFYLDGQSTGAQKGIYVCGAVSGGVAIFTRAADWAAGLVIKTGALIAVDAGTVNANTLWMITNAGDVTVGTTTPTIAEASAAALGLTLSGGVLTSAYPFNIPAGTVAAVGLSIAGVAGTGLYQYAGAYPACAKAGTRIWWGGDGVLHSDANFYTDGALLCAAQLDLTAIAAGGSNFKFTKTTDTPATTYTAHVASTDPAGYVEIREAAGGATPYYIPFFT